MEQRADQRNKALADRFIAPLFVPGSRPDRVRKARERGASAVVIDLEDAVLPDQKVRARKHTAEVLAERLPGIAHLVRVNAETDLLHQDVAALREVLPGVDAVILPKTVSADQVRALEALLPAGVPIIPTIETAVGVREAFGIAAAGPAVHTLLFGTVDLSADLGITATAEGAELATARSTVVLACAAAGLARPLDGPYLNIGDPLGLRVSSRAARQLGFGGKVVIHPDQLTPVRESFAPTTEEVTWARRVLATYEEAVARGEGAVRMADGTFIDVPVAEQARTILRAADLAEAGPWSR